MSIVAGPDALPSDLRAMQRACVRHHNLRALVGALLLPYMFLGGQLSALAGRTGALWRTLLTRKFKRLQLRVYIIGIKLKPSPAWARELRPLSRWKHSYLAASSL
jgi:hypothetical protein